MITIKFAEKCDLKRVKRYEFKTYKAFFYFFIINYDKGIIFDVKEVPDGQHNPPRET